MTTRRSFHVFRSFSFNFFGRKKMTGDNVKVLENKAVEAESLAAELRTELSKLQAVVNALKLSSPENNTSYRDLVQENQRLKAEIEEYKKKLTGRVGNLSLLQESVAVFASPKPKETTPEAPKVAPAAAKKAPKEKAEKPAKEKAAVDKAASEEPPVDIGRLDLRVGKIVEVKKHPDADSLYVEQIDIGEPKPRTIVSGLVKFVPIEQMQNRLVIVLCNLKPAKMRGVTSEGMVMCASTPDKVEVLSPPAGSVPGDVVQVAGFPRVPDPVLNPKKKIFETVAPDLCTNDKFVATYKGVPWEVVGKGNIKTESLVGVKIK